MIHTGNSPEWARVNKNSTKSNEMKVGERNPAEGVGMTTQTVWKSKVYESYTFMLWEKNHEVGVVPRKKKGWEILGGF